MIDLLNATVQEISDELFELVDTKEPTPVNRTMAFVEQIVKLQESRNGNILMLRKCQEQGKREMITVHRLGKLFESWMDGKTNDGNFRMDFVKILQENKS